MSLRRPAVLAAGLVVLALVPAAAAQAAGRGGAVAEPAAAPPANGQPVPGEVLVGFKRGASASERSAARRKADVSVKRALLVPGVQLVKAAAGESIDAAIARLERDPNVRYAEPNRVRTTTATTNDPLLGELWGLDKIDAPEAWDVFSGGDPVIAVVDQGIRYDHPDLAPNMWRNPGEIAGNGADDDGNGFVDDVFGADTVNNDGDPMDEGGHGTHVAGTIAAAGNNGLGLTGVTQRARLMAVQGLGASGSGTDAQIADAFEYAASMGARVVNASLGGAGGGATMHAPILAHPETLFIVAAGNDGGNNDSVAGPDTFPCKYPDDNLICVAATNPDDSLASYSNTGTTSVDLAAPGTIVLSAGLGRSQFTDGFEGNDFATRWKSTITAGGAPNWGLTAPGGASAHAVSDSPAGDYGPNVRSYLDLQTPMNLSGASGCVLNFIAKTALGAGDAFVVDRSVNGGATFSRRLSVTSSTGSYRSFNVGLSADGQPSVMFSFGLESNAVGQGDGVSVDDVSVSCTTAPAGDAYYRFLDGTSMATPHVTGAAALLLGRKPALTVAQLRAALLNTGDPLPALGTTTVTGRRLNVNNAIRSADLVVPPVAQTGAASGITASAATLNGTVNPRSTATSWQFEYGTTTAYGLSTATVDAGSGGADQAVSTAVGGLTPNTTYHYRLVAIRGGSRFPGADSTFKTAAPSVVVPPPTGGNTPTASLAKRVKGARVACTRKRGTYRCRVSLTRASGMKVKLVLRRGTKILARGSGKVGKRITLKGKKAKAGRFKIRLTFTEGTKKASITKRLRVR